MPKRMLRFALLILALLPAALLLARTQDPEPPPGHRHAWREFEPPSGALVLVDERGAALRRLHPGKISRIKVIGSPNTDQCIAPGCPFGADGIASECLGPRVVGFTDHSAGGAFGCLDATGRFIPLTDADAAYVTHYRAPERPGPVRLAACFDDAARTVAPGGAWVATFNDAPHECRPYRVVVETIRRDNH